MDAASRLIQAAGRRRRRGGDFDGRERLARYCARPAVSLERLSLLKDGRIAYRIKRSSRGRGPSHRIMTPLELMVRLAGIIAPPRHPLIRFHGVLAPYAKWRPEVVPRKREGVPACSSSTPTGGPKPSKARARSRDPRARDERASPGPSF